MSRGRKSFSSSITDNWEKAFFNSIGHYITLINSGLRKSFKSEPLSNHIKIVGGFAFKNAEYKSAGIPIIRISDFNNEHIVLDDVVYYEESPLLEKYELRESDIIIALTGGTIGKLGIVQPGLGKLYLNQRVGKFDILNPDEFEKEYIYWIARGVEGIVKNLAWGAAIPNVSPKQIEELNFPIPTKDIQKTIIRFLNDLKENTLINETYFDFEIENEIKIIQEKQVKTREVQDELSHQLTLLSNLNQAILQEAVQGKLVPQDENDEPASVLLERIKINRLGIQPDPTNNIGLKPNDSAINRAGFKPRPIKPRPIKELPPIQPEEIPFEIPENWVWCRLGEICERIHYGFNASAKPQNSGVRLLRITDIQESKVDWETVPGCDYTKSDLDNYLLNEDDIVIARTGGTIGKTFLVKNIPLQSLFASYLIRAIPSKKIFPEYVKLFMESPIYWKQLYEAAGGAAQPNVNGTSLSNLFFPLPPLSEQKRIVAAIEKQFALTQQLKEKVLANQQATEQLLKALLHQAFEVREVKEVNS